MIPKLFVHNKDKSWYYVTKKLENCFVCNEDIVNNMVVHPVFNRKSFYMKFYCLKCIKKIGFRGTIADGLIWCIVTPTIPKDSSPVILRYPDLVPGKFGSVFNPELWQKSEGKVIDHTILAGREDEVARLEIEKNQKLLEKRDEELDKTYFNVDSFFDTVKESKVLIKKEKIKRIEDGTEKGQADGSVGEISKKDEEGIILHRDKHNL